MCKGFNPKLVRLEGGPSHDVSSLAACGFNPKLVRLEGRESSTDICHLSVSIPNWFD